MGENSHVEDSLSSEVMWGLQLYPWQGIGHNDARAAGICDRLLCWALVLFSQQLHGGGAFSQGHTVVEDMASTDLSTLP